MSDPMSSITDYRYEHLTNTSRNLTHNYLLNQSIAHTDTSTNKWEVDQVCELEVCSDTSILIGNYLKVMNFHTPFSPV